MRMRRGGGCGRRLFRERGACVRHDLRSDRIVGKGIVERNVPVNVTCDRRVLRVCGAVEPELAEPFRLVRDVSDDRITGLVDGVEERQLMRGHHDVDACRLGSDLLGVFPGRVGEHHDEVDLLAQIREHRLERLDRIEDLVAGYHASRSSLQFVHANDSDFERLGPKPFTAQLLDDIRLERHDVGCRGDDVCRDDAIKEGEPLEAVRVCRLFHELGEIRQVAMRDVRCPELELVERLENPLVLDASLRSHCRKRQIVGQEIARIDLKDRDRILGLTQKCLFVADAPRQTPHGMARSATRLETAVQVSTELDRDRIAVVGSDAFSQGLRIHTTGLAAQLRAHRRCANPCSCEENRKCQVDGSLQRSSHAMNSFGDRREVMSLPSGAAGQSRNENLAVPGLTPANIP